MTDEKAIIPVEQKTIFFYDDEVTAVRTEDDVIFIPIRPIIERLGLNWSGQYSRLRRDPVLREEASICVIQTDRLGARETVCLPLDYLSGFLFGINADRVRPEYREDVLRYQRECHRVLTEAMRDGRLTIEPDDALAGVSPETAQALEIARAVLALANSQAMLEMRLTGQIQGIEARLETVEATLGDTGRNVTPDQAAQLSQAVKAVALAVGRKSGRNEYGGVYGEFYRRFGITSYKLLPARRFDDAMAWLTEWHETVTGQGELPF